MSVFLAESGGSSAGAGQAVGSRSMSSGGFKGGTDVKTSSHFMPYFITVTIVVVMLYVIYHKRNLVMMKACMLVARISYLCGE